MKLTAVLMLSAAISVAADLTSHAGNGALTAHEWGTFTSVAGADGKSVEWAPLYGQPDLPCFVDRLNTVASKSTLSGLVRMETPVLYFYSQRPVTLSVKVEFPQGWMTEWYPQASKVSPAAPVPIPFTGSFQNGELDWDSVLVLPGEDPAFPAGKNPSRYYAARKTDAAPLLVGLETEKLLFYRGIASFPAPLQPRFTSDGKLEIRNAGSNPIPLAILFENRGGKVGYRIAHSIGDTTTLDPPELTGDLATLRQDLTGALVEYGLYQKEALAMLETWHDSWFEEGMRVIYIVPRPEVDSLLPLTIDRAPSTTTRVFVGRVEILSPAMRDAVRTAVTRNDTAALTKIGRFLQPFAEQMGLRVPRAGVWSAASCVE